MNKYKKQAIIVLLLSLLFAFEALLLLVFSDINETRKIIFLIILPIWLFSLLPAAHYGYYRLRDRRMLDYKEGFKTTLAMTLHLIVLPIVLAPFLMVKYYLYVWDKIKQFKL